MNDLQEPTQPDLPDSLPLLTVNFCELPDDKLLQLIDFLGEKEITERSKMEQTIIDNKCVKKKWDWYSQLTVYPDKITSCGHVTVTLITSEKFAKMQALFINGL